MQVVLSIDALPDAPIDASAAFAGGHLAEAERLLGEDDTRALAICLPLAGADHDDWRRSLARDLARKWTPKRVNVIGANPGKARETMLLYLADAYGMTGQYCPAHE